MQFIMTPSYWIIYNREFGFFSLSLILFLRPASDSDSDIIFDNEDENSKSQNQVNILMEVIPFYSLWDGDIANVWCYTLQVK